MVGESKPAALCASAIAFSRHWSQPHGAYEAMPLPNDQSSFAHSTRLMRNGSPHMGKLKRLNQPIQPVWAYILVVGKRCVALGATCHIKRDRPAVRAWHPEAAQFPSPPGRKCSPAPWCCRPITPKVHPPLARRNQSRERIAPITMPDHNLFETISVLSRTPAVLNALLRDLPDSWTRRNEGGATWTAIDVVGHLIHGEKTDWMPRVRLILEHADLRPFEPFDMKGHVREIAGKSLPELTDEFAQVRAANIRDLQALNLQPGDLSRPGLHPALGPVTLRQLLASWPAHDLTHIHQLSRIMAHQYREAVGPWSAYMGVMQCGGHGSR